MLNKKFMRSLKLWSSLFPRRGIFGQKARRLGYGDNESEGGEGEIICFKYDYSLSIRWAVLVSADDNLSQ